VRSFPLRHAGVAGPAVPRSAGFGRSGHRAGRAPCRLHPPAGFVIIERYRRTIAAYDEDLVAKRGRRAVSSPAETEELEIRIALVDRVRAAHQERLRSLLLDRQSMMADAQRARLVERLRRIREAQAGDAGAVASLKATP
jgi:hypothetical protein